MKKYRLAEEQTDISSIDPSLAETTKQIDSWQHYVADYLDDQEDISVTVQTIKEEYAAYVTSLPKRGSVVDTVRFWEVCY